MLRAWYNQLERDCPKDKLPVLFNQANGYEPVAFFPLKSALVMKIECLGVRAIHGDSFCAIEHLAEIAFAKELGQKLGHPVLEIPFLLGFKVEDEKIFLVTDGKSFLKVMLDYEQAQVRLEERSPGSPG